MDADKIAFRGMSIHKIYSHKLPLDTQSTTEQHIDTIIRAYNFANNDEPELKSSHDFKVVENLNWDEKKRKFHARVYYSQRPYTTGFARWLGVTQDAPKGEYGAKSIHFVCFLYRKVPDLEHDRTVKKTKEQWELFALTTNDGGHVVKKYADYRFPLQITMRLIEPKFSHKLTKPLAGPKDSTSETYREEYSLKQHEMETAWLLFKEFNSHFKPTCSLYNPQYKLSAFVADGKDKEIPEESFQEKDEESKEAEKPQEAENNKVSVEVGVGKIVIGRSLTMRQYEEVLEHFSLISRGVKTFLFKEGKKREEKEDTAFRHLENIQHVQIELVPKLNNALLELVWSYYNKEPLKGELNFTHRFQTDFYNSCEFTLKYRDQLIFWNYHPSLFEVLEALRLLFGSVKSRAEFLSLIGEVKFKFNLKNRFFPLKEFFHGELKFNDRTYFHIDGLWLQVKSDHLARLNRSFFEFLREHLLSVDHPAQLLKPWYAKKQWVAFGPDDFPKGVDSSVFETTLKELEGETFSFIDDKGHVLCPYPTQCLLEDHGFGIEFTKTLQKNWESLRLLLSDKQKQKSPLTENDLEEFFEGKSKGDSTFPDKLLQILKQERKVLTKTQVRVSKATVLRGDATPLISDISSLSFRIKSITDNVDPINKLLKRRQKKGEPCTQEDIEGVLPDSQKRHSGAVFSQLSQPVGVKSGSLEGSRYIVQGPLPSKFKADAGVLQFLREQHEKYRLVLSEEGYNRLYLKEKRFLVCDQVYAGKKEKVELFDVMQYGVDGKAYLYHVKEGFGQKTGEACRQIRVAAVNIRNAIKSGDYKILRKLYDQATLDGKTSPFAKAVKESFEDLPKLPEDKQDSDRFTRLFPVGKRQICFVYAFIDDADKRERFLEDEKNPSYTFKEEDFVPLEKETEQSAKELFQTMKEFLNEFGQITDRLLLMTVEQFSLHMKDKLKDPKKVYDFMQKRISQFDSLGAKIELLHLQDFLRELDFDFQVCQIRRSQGAQSKPATGRSSEWADFTDERWDGVSSSPYLPFTYEGTSFTPQERSMTIDELLCNLLKTPHHAHSLKSTVYALFVKHKKTNKKLFEAHFEEMKKRKKLQSSKLKLFSTYNVQQYNQFFEEYLKCILYTSFQFEEQELGLIVKLLRLKVTIFTMDEGQTVALKNPLIFTFDEKEKQVGHILVKDRSQHFRFCRGKDAQEEEEDASLPLSQLSNTLPQDLQEELLSQECMLSPMDNVHNDCFFNSILQMLFHSSLFKHLVDENALVDQGSGKPFFSFIYELALDYALAQKVRERDNTLNRAASYPREDMRTLLKMQPFQQEDAGEALTRFLEFYDTSKIVSQFMWERTLDLTKKKVAPQISTHDHSTVNARGVFENPDSELVLKIPFLDAQNDLTSMIEAIFKPKQIKGTFSFVFKDKGYQVEEYREKKKVQELQNTLFIQLERFSQGAHAQILKNSKKVLVESFCTIEDQIFELRGFIVHIGDTPNLGHYIAYCKTSSGWFCFNDSRKPEELHEDSALEIAKEAYLLHYQKVVE